MHMEDKIAYYESIVLSEVEKQDGKYTTKQLTIFIKNIMADEPYKLMVDVTDAVIKELNKRKLESKNIHYHDRLIENAHNEYICPHCGSPADSGDIEYTLIETRVVLGNGELGESLEESGHHFFCNNCGEEFEELDYITIISYI